MLFGGISCIIEKQVAVYSALLIEDIYKINGGKVNEEYS